ncbi:MAG: tetratricopeptide repeat protein [Candidatus Lindowbacteria bacterium]|nr:tetratricopeptide repeat protein [Candidatus Lindowbacteria bacterium]
MDEAARTGPDSQLEAVFAEADRLFEQCEADGNLDKAEAMLTPLTERIADASLLARVYAMLAQREFWRHYYAPEEERLAIAEKGIGFAQKALEIDPKNLYANYWAALLMGIHGLEMGILSALFYMEKIKGCAEQVVELDESYMNGGAHQVLGDLYRLTPPPPVAFGDKEKAVEHLLRANELSPNDPQARLRLAEAYFSVRQKDKARREAEHVLNQKAAVRGPIYTENMKKWAREILAKV